MGWPSLIKYSFWFCWLPFFLIGTLSAQNKSDDHFKQLVEDKNATGLYHFLLGQRGDARDRVRMSFDILDLYETIDYQNDTMIGYCHYKAAIALGTLNQYDSSLYHFQQAMDFFRRGHPESHPRIYSVFFQMADKLLLMENCKEAREALDTCINLQWDSDRTKWSETWRFLARYFGKVGDLDRFFIALEIAMPFANSNLLERIFDTRIEYLTALGHPEKALAILDSMDGLDFDARLAGLYGTVHQDLRRYTAAENYFRYERNLREDDDVRRAFASINLGNVLLQSGRVDEAIELYNEAEHLGAPYKDKELEYSFRLGLSRAYCEHEQYSKALIISTELVDQFESDASIPFAARGELFILHLGNLLRQWTESGTGTDSQLVLDFARNVSDNLTQIRLHLDRQQSRQDYAVLTRRINDALVKALHSIWESSCSQEIAGETLVFLERNKAQILAEEFRTRGLKHSEQFESSLNYYRAELKQADVKQQKALSDSLAKYFLLSEMEGSQRMNLLGERTAEAEEQLQIPEETVVFHFYQGLDSMLTIVGSFNGYHNMIRLEPSQYFTQIFNQTDSFRIPEQRVSIDSLHGVAKFIRSFVPTEVNQIIVIPDGIVALVPSEILFGNLKVDYDISSAHSLSVLQEQQSKMYDGNPFAIAPSFDHEEWKKSEKFETYTRAGINPLLHNAEEVKGIKQMLPSTKVLLGETATVKSFKNSLPGMSTIHLSTHAVGNVTDDLEPHILFYGDDQVSNTLTLSDIYNLDLSANMVVMSACETGIGEYVAGEGVMSLARGFAYAGAKSVIASLWAVNDESTSKIMVHLYKHLKDGKRKDTALRLAKQDYLATASPRQSHPYYWAGFIAIGDMSPLDFGFQFNWFFWVGLVTILLVAGTLLLRRKKV